MIKNFEFEGMEYNSFIAKDYGDVSGFPFVCETYSTQNYGELQKFFRGAEIVTTEEGVWKKIIEEVKGGSPDYPSRFFATYEVATGDNQ
jgi:hypothetical protein